MPRGAAPFCVASRGRLAILGGMNDADPWQAPAGLAGYRWPAPARRATVLLQHGYAEHAGRYVDHYSRLIPALNGAGFDVHAFDLAGHGRSPGARGVTNIGEMADALSAARAALADRGPLFLFGHSLGGLVTALSVARAPDALAGVVLSGPYLPFGTGAVTRTIARLLAAVAPAAGVASLGDPSGISRLPDEVRAYVDDPLVFKRRIPARLGATALAAGAEVERGLVAWRAPTFVFHGTADTYTNPKGSERLVAGIASADKELMLVAEGRHELLNDVGREAVLARMLEWLERHLP